MKKILIVDDDSLILSVLETLLSDYHIFKAHDGLQALNILRKIPDIKLLITDVNMPRMNGIDLIKSIMKEDYRIKIVVLTAFGSTDIEKMTYQNGFSYIEKPFDADDLLELVQDNLRDGFTGKLKSIQISDIIQLICITRNTGVLKVSHLGKEGRIYFKNGNMIHAQCDSTEPGEEAFYTIFSWSNGSFDMINYTHTPKITMKASYEYYMFEAVRRIDEGEKKNKELEEKRLKKELEAFNEEYTLRSHLRKIVFLDHKHNAVKVHRLYANEKDITSQGTIEANKDYEIIAQFYKYKTKKLKINIPSNANTQQVEVGDPLIQKTYSFHFPHYTVDGVDYDPIIFIDGEKYERHHYTLNPECYGVYQLEIYVPEASKHIKIMVGYITLEWNITETKSFKNYGVCVSNFLTHLSNVGKNIGFDRCITTFHELLFESYISFKIKRSLQKAKEEDLRALIEYMKRLDYPSKIEEKVKEIIDILAKQ